VTPQQGDVYWAETEDKRRPVLVITRTQAVPVLRWIIVAPITRTVRGIGTEIGLGPDDGLREECVAAFDDLHPMPRALLTERIGSLGPRRWEICRALSALADC
jgi:mRNA interferase MazF